MAKATEPKAPKQHRSRSQDEMQAALNDLAVGGGSAIPPHYDLPMEILKDAIEELIQLRQLRADVLTFIQDQQAKLTRR